MPNYWRVSLFLFSLLSVHGSMTPHKEGPAAHVARKKPDIAQILKQNALTKPGPTKEAIKLNSTPEPDENNQGKGIDENKPGVKNPFPNIRIDLQKISKQKIFSILGIPTRNKNNKSQSNTKTPKNGISAQEEVEKPRKMPRILNIRHDLKHRMTPVDMIQRRGHFFKTIREFDETPMEQRRIKAPTTLGKCGGSYSGINGLVGSPNHPHKYSKNMHCRYAIRVDLQHLVRLKCSYVSIQPGHDGKCEYDYIEVYWTNSTGQQTSKRYCGNDGFEVTSSSNKINLLFHSDDEYSYSGFLCQFSSIDVNGQQVLEENDISKTPTGYDICAFQSDGTWTGKCGVSNKDNQKKRDKRTAKGITTNAHEFPWMVAVLKVCGKNRDEYCHICGGTIIDEMWILTAAHCVYGTIIEDLLLLFGDHDLYTLTESQIDLEVSEVHTHPSFSYEDPLNSNFALLKTLQQIDFATSHLKIGPICLPLPNTEDFLKTLPDVDKSSFKWVNDDDYDPDYYDPEYMSYFSLKDYVNPDIMFPEHDFHIGRNVTLAGWGYTNTLNELAEKLNTVNMTLLPSGVCQYYYEIMTRLLICSSGKGGAGPCFGDSGSPLMMLMSDGRWVQVATHIFGSIYCGKEYPSVSGAIVTVMDWISLVTQVDFSKYY